LRLRRIDDGAGRRDILGPGSVAGIQVVANLLASRLESRPVGVEIRGLKPLRGRFLAEPVNADGDRAGGVAERNIANGLAADLDLRAVQRAAINSGVVDLIDGDIEGISREDVALLGVVAQPRLDLVELRIRSRALSSSTGLILPVGFLVRFVDIF